MLSLPLSPLDDGDNLRWEFRCFWPENAIIILQGLDHNLLKLSHYETKKKDDVYFLLPDSHYNLKLRRNDFVYKPLLKQLPHRTAYGNKIKLHNEASLDPRSRSPNIDITQLLKRMKQEGKKITVQKETLCYRFNTKPNATIELERLMIGNVVYFSICIESRSGLLVDNIAKHLLKEPISCDYVSFLKQLESAPNDDIRYP